MKKLIILLAFVIVAITANAQQKITNSKTFRVVPTNADTLNLNDVDYNYLTQPFK